MNLKIMFKSVILPTGNMLSSKQYSRRMQE